jgi:hypothetical protein
MAAMTHQLYHSFNGSGKSAMVKNDLIELNDAPRMDPCPKGSILTLTYFQGQKNDGEDTLLFQQ